MKDPSLSQSEIEALLREVQEGEEKNAHDDMQVTLETEQVQQETFVASEKHRSQRPVSVEPAQFEELEIKSASDKLVSDIDLLLDIPLSVTVELGKAKCYVKDLLNLTMGSIVELDKLAGDPVDILINGKLFARGEVVVIDENFGVRIQEIVNKEE
ncbi:MAG TPA: flagellar motor switch protein FliN [Bacillota bacterium]|nr:flagellar motor switch protein FliN [Candidatus Fermentithermobacillaceae bacterium]HPP61307.1 flagellar motor switch protein FliN [Bacillota bacterium]